MINYHLWGSRLNLIESTNEELKKFAPKKGFEPGVPGIPSRPGMPSRPFRPVEVKECKLHWSLY